MFRRLGWIVASYFTRPLFLALVAGGLFCAAINWFEKQRTTYDTNYPQAPAPHLFIGSKATLEAVRREGRQDEVDAINLHYLWRDMRRPKVPVELTRPGGRLPGEAFFRILEEFPNLRIVTVMFYGDMTGAEQIASLRNLEYLSINGPARVVLSWLRPLAKLRWLELALFTPPAGLKTLETLPNLETIVFRSRLEVTDDVLETVADLPHLKQLALNFSTNSMPEPHLTVAGFSALDRSKSLETLYVGGFMPHDRGALTALAKSALPRLDVEPSFIATRPPVLFLVCPVMLLAAVIGIGLAAQFRGPLSRLAPGFVASHTLVASTFFAATVLLGATHLMAAGNDPLASTIVSAALVATAVCLLSADLSPSPTNPRTRQLGNLLKIVMLFCALSPLVIAEHGDATILEGNQPYVLALLGLVAVAAVGLTANGLRRLMKSSSSTSLLDRDGYRPRFLRQAQFTPGWLYAVAGREQQIEAWQSGRPRWTSWRRVRRWQTGNAPFRSVPFMLMFLGFFVPFGFLFRTMLVPGPTRPPWTQNFSGLRAQFLVMVFMLLLMAAARVAAVWRARLLTLPTELLRPYSRRALQNEMAAAFVLDLAPPTLVVAAFWAVGVNLDSQLAVAWGRVPIAFVIAALAVPAMTVGMGALVVVVKRDWLVVVLLLTIGIVTVVAIALVTAAQVSPRQMMQQLPPRVIEAQLCVPAAVGIVLAWLMRRRFMAMEIGSRV